MGGFDIALVLCVCLRFICCFALFAFCLVGCLGVCWIAFDCIYLLFVIVLVISVVKVVGLLGGDLFVVGFG